MLSFRAAVLVGIIGLSSCFNLPRINLPNLQDARSSFNEFQGLMNVASPGSCPDVPLQENFDISRFSGTWHELERSPNLFQIGMKCRNVTYTTSSSGSVGVVDTSVNKWTGFERTKRGSVTPDAAEPANLTMNFNMEAEVKHMILSTDYSSYALVYSCQQILSVFRTNVLKTEHAWILTRERGTLSSEIVDQLKSILTTNGISLQLTQSDQTGCDDTPSSIRFRQILLTGYN